MGPEFLLYVYDDMVMDQDNVVMFEQCFNIMNPKALERMDMRNGGHEPCEGDKKVVYRILSA